MRLWCLVVMFVCCNTQVLSVEALQVYLVESPVVDAEPVQVLMDVSGTRVHLLGLHGFSACALHHPRDGVWELRAGDSKIMRASQVDDRLKGQWLRPGLGWLPRGATFTAEKVGSQQDVLDSGRRWQLQRRPRLALLAYLYILRRHLTELDLSAPALVHAREVAVSMRSDATVQKIYKKDLQGLVPQLPDLSSDTGFDDTQARKAIQDSLQQRLNKAAQQPSKGVQDGKQNEQEKAETDPKVIRIGLIGELHAEVSVGSTQRFNEGVIVERPSGDVIDGGVAIGLRHRDGAELFGLKHGDLEHALSLSLSTDFQAAEEGVALVGLSLLQKYHTERTSILGYTIQAEAAYSEERDWIINTDLFLSLLHLGFHNDARGRTYRIGIGLGLARHKDSDDGFWVNVDRLIDHKIGHRFMATETAFGGKYSFENGFFFKGAASYLYGGHRLNGVRDNEWQVLLGLGWEMGE